MEKGKTKGLKAQKQTIVVKMRITFLD